MLAIYMSRGASLPSGLVLDNDSKPQPFEFGRGPDGDVGTFYFWCDPTRQSRQMPLTYNEGIQKWTRASQTMWIGEERGLKIEPHDLARLEQYSSLEVMLADGQMWKVPITAHLPRTWGLGVDGAFTRAVRPEFREYCELSEDVWNSVVMGKESDARVQIPKAWDYCCRALALNYRVCPEIVSHLGLIDDSVVAKVLGASIELDQIEEVAELKKNEITSASTQDTSEQ